MDRFRQRRRLGVVLHDRRQPKTLLEGLSDVDLFPAFLVKATPGPPPYAVVRPAIGEPRALKAAAGTIRGDYSSSRQMNLVHASDGPEASAREIALYFQPEEICDYEPTLTPWLKAGDE